MRLTRAALNFVKKTFAILDLKSTKFAKVFSYTVPDEEVESKAGPESSEKGRESVVEDHVEGQHTEEVLQ